MLLMLSPIRQKKQQPPAAVKTCVGAD